MWCRMSGRSAGCLRNALGLRCSPNRGEAQTQHLGPRSQGPHDQQLRVFSDEIPASCFPTPAWAQGGCQAGPAPVHHPAWPRGRPRLPSQSHFWCRMRRPGFRPSSVPMSLCDVGAGAPRPDLPAGHPCLPPPTLALCPPDTAPGGPGGPAAAEWENVTLRGGCFLCRRFN